MNQLLPDEKFIKRAIKLICSAEHSIYLSTFKAEISHSPLGLSVIPFYDEVMKKAKEKKDVKLLINWNDKRSSVPKTNLLVMKKIKESGGLVRTLQNNRCCHAKIIIIDKRFAIIGSHNLSVKSCTANFEVSFFIDDLVAIKALLGVYFDVWQKAKKY